MLSSLVFIKAYPRRTSDSFSRLTFTCPEYGRKISLSLDGSANSHGIISFADPHPLNSVASYRYKNRGRGAVPRFHRSDVQPFNIPMRLYPKSFTCNTYKKQREGCRLWLTKWPGPVVRRPVSPSALCPPVANQSSILGTLFQVPYAVTPLFATLTKTPGCGGFSSHFGLPLYGPPRLCVSARTFSCLPLSATPLVFPGGLLPRALQ
jgi:hypothetical protein